VGRDPDAERAALEVIERASRDALGEMRRLVTVLRHEDADEASREPAPRLTDLHDMVATVAQAGVTVDVRTSGDLTQLPPGPSLSAYRVIQEALTNVVRHAGPTRARLVVEAVDETLAICVEDEGRPRGEREPRAAGGGHGTIGMRERVELYGGSLDAGPTPAGGWRVEARIPFERSS
jgi:signal transduction histidine kinase